MVAQGNSIASEALNTASQIMTAAQAVASEAINKLSLEIGAGTSKACVVAAGKSTCVDYASKAAADDMKKVADMLSDASGRDALTTAASTLGGLHVAAFMSCMLPVTLASLAAYLLSCLSGHRFRIILLSAVTMLGIAVTGCMLGAMLVIVFLRSKASGTIGSAGSLESSPCMKDTIICFFASAVQSTTSLAKLLMEPTAASTPRADAASATSTNDSEDASVH